MARSESKVKGSYFVSTISIALVLLVVGALIFIVLNARMLSHHVKRNIGFVVVIKDDANEAEVIQLQKIIETAPYTYSAKYVDKDRAAEIFKEEMGEDFEMILGTNPLKASIEIRMNPIYANNDSLTVIESRLQRFDVIEELYYRKSTVEAINKNMNKIAILFLTAAFVLMLISFTLISNTIHLLVYSQRLLIKTMQLVGAKRFFIARPFLSRGVWQGFFGGMIAVILLVGALFFLQHNYGNTIEVNILHWQVIGIMIGGVLLSGIILSLFSAWFSVNSYLKRDLNDIF